MTLQGERRELVSSDLNSADVVHFDPKTQLLFGDAKDSLGKVLAAVKAL